MSDIEPRIRESYDRLKVGGTVYLLRNVSIEYGQLPDPDSVTGVFKADITQVDPTYMLGVYLVDWLDLHTRPEPDEAGSIYRVSPREVFKLEELNTVIGARTALPTPRPSKLDKLLGSESGKFSAIVASEMARVVLERFADDPRDEQGRIIKR